MPILDIRDPSEFNQKVLQADRPGLVEFWAVWCGACLQVAPVIDEIAKESAGQLTVAKVNIDIDPDTLWEYGVRGTPWFIIFHNGQPESAKVGSLRKDKLVRWIDSIIAGTAEPA